MMRFAYPDILQFETPWRSYGWSATDAILYALALGLGADPLDPAMLGFVQEDDQRVLPTFATMAAFGAGISPALLGVPVGASAHLSQSAHFHRPLSAAGVVFASTRVVSVADRGTGRSALLETETSLRDETGGPVATLRRVGLLRGFGGFDGPKPEERAPTADRGAPTARLMIATRPDQALLYRLCGDRNPLHVDPTIARRAGFPRPILHGLATYGLIGAALLKAYGGMDPARMRSLSMTFAGPILPGEAISLDVWRSAAGTVFEAVAVDRDAVVVRDGFADLGDMTR